MKHCSFLVIFFLLFIASLSAYGANLTVKLSTELPKEVKKNIFSHLGQLPDTELERSAFIYSAKDNITDALQALGYYQAQVSTAIDKELWQLTLNIDLGKPTILAQVLITIEGDAQHDKAFQALLTAQHLIWRHTSSR